MGGRSRDDRRVGRAAAIGLRVSRLSRIVAAAWRGGLGCRQNGACICFDDARGTSVVARCAFVALASDAKPCRMLATTHAASFLTSNSSVDSLSMTVARSGLLTTDVTCCGVPAATVEAQRRRIVNGKCGDDRFVVAPTPVASV